MPAMHFAGKFALAVRHASPCSAPCPGFCPGPSFSPALSLILPTLVNFPLHTLRRGYRFSSRARMRHQPVFHEAPPRMAGSEKNSHLTMLQQQQQEQEKHKAYVHEKQMLLADQPLQLKRQKASKEGGSQTTFLDVIRAGNGEIALRIMRCFPSGDYFKDREFAACFALYSTCRTCRMCPAINQNISTLRWWLDNSGSKNNSGQNNHHQKQENTDDQQDSSNGGDEQQVGQTQQGGNKQQDSCSGSSGGGGNNTGKRSGGTSNREPLLAPHQRWPKYAPPVKVLHIGTTYDTVVGVQEQRQLQLGLCTMVRAGAAHPVTGALRNLTTLRLSVSGMAWDDLMAGLLWCNLAQSVRCIEMWSDARCLCTANFIQQLALLPRLESLDLDEQVVIENINKCHGPKPAVVLQEHEQSGHQGKKEEEPDRAQHPQQQQQLQELNPEEQQQLQQQQQEEGEEQDEAAKHDKYQCGVPPSLLSHLYQLRDLKVCMHARPGCLVHLSGLTGLTSLTLQGVLSADGQAKLDPLTTLTNLQELTVSPWMESVHETPWDGPQHVYVESMAHLTGITKLAFLGWVESCWDMVLHGLDSVAHPFNNIQCFEVSGPIRLAEGTGSLWWPALQDVDIDGEVPLATMAKLTQHLAIQHVERLLGRSLLG